MLIWLLLLPITSIYAQQDDEIYNSSLTISTDNDIFVVGWDFDRFYSFGLGADFNFRNNKFLGLEKVFSSKTDYFMGISARLEGYTSSNAERYAVTPQLEDNDDFDRPWAGLLFADLSANYMFKRSYVKLGILVGIIGPASQAGALQTYWHEDISNDLTYEGWQFQIPNQFLVNFSGTYAYDFTPGLKGFDVYVKAAAFLGNLYIKAQPTIGFRFGEFESITKSIAMGNDVLLKKGDYEFFIHSTVGLSINYFDATAQGNLFDQDNIYKVDRLNRQNLTMSHGLYFSSNAISLFMNYRFSYGRVLKGKDHVYGVFGGSFRF